MPEGTIDQKLYERLIRAIGWVEGQPNYGGGLRGSRPVESATLNVFRNNSGEEVPAFAVMEVEDVEVVDNRNIPIIKKPTGDATKPHIINGPIAVSSGNRGRWQWGTVKVAVTGTPTAGAEWGVSASSWVLSSGGSAIMRMLGLLETGFAMGQPLGNGRNSCTSLNVVETQMVSTDSVGCVGFRMRTKTVYINADGCLEATDGDWSDTVDLATCGALNECCPGSSSFASSYSEGECCATFAFGDYNAGTQGDLVIENHSATPTYLEGGTTFTISWDVRNSGSSTVDTWITLTWDNEQQLDYQSATPTPDGTSICYNEFSAFAFNRCVIWEDQSFTAGETKSYSVTLEFNCQDDTSGSDDVYATGAILADGFGTANPDGSANPIHPKRNWAITETACSSTSGPGSSSASAPP